jgi:hypothetical protein
MFPVDKIRLRISVLLLLIILLICCKTKNDLNPYQNQFGINPATIAQLDTVNYTTIQWIDSIKNIGQVFYGDTILINYRFKNTGNGPLYITEVKPQCGCTVAKYPKQAIPPNQSALIVAKYTTEGFPGSIKKFISVKSNTSNGIFHYLQFYGKLGKDSLLHTNKKFIK